MAKLKAYVVKAGGIKLPGLKKEDAKLNGVVKLDPKHAEGFVKRGFLIDADMVVSGNDPAALRKEIAELTKAVDAKDKEIAELTKAVDDLTSSQQ